MINKIEIAFKIGTAFLLVSGLYLMFSGFTNSRIDNQVSGGLFLAMGAICALHSEAQHERRCAAVGRLRSGCY
jgi:hypothetical protein